MPSLISLVPNSGVQFWDVDLDIDRLPRTAFSFWEEKIGATGAQEKVALRELQDDGAGTLVVKGTAQAPDVDETYAVGRTQALEMHLGRWVPLPYFMFTPSDAIGGRLYERGPSNWARARLVEHPDPHPGATHRLTLAFDTSLMPRLDKRPYAALSPDNSQQKQEFAFVSEWGAISWFLDEKWVGDWLRDLLVKLRREQRHGRPLREEDLPYACDHYARYMVFVWLLGASEALPQVKLIDVVSENPGYRPVAVDLVLDIGNSRACGILIEEHPGEGQQLVDSYPLSLRDLSCPELTHTRPFDSRVEFSCVDFGAEAFSRPSGRSAAFAWPSPARVGPEARRLAARRQGNEGASGLSSPKRYLWDERPFSQGWHFNGFGLDGTTLDPPLNGSFMSYVTQDGRVPRRGGSWPTTVKALFSRSSLFTFMLAEILMQALRQINAPDTRAQRRDAEIPRRLRSVLLTLPPGMPVREQRILKERAEAAVRLTWAMLKWEAQAQPVVRTDLDEATATQIVWLHNEVSERLQGDAGALMEMVGRIRPEIDVLPVLRVASIDVGGGTTDLMIATYSRREEALVPHQDFRESFKIAGDDVVERLITTVILPQIGQDLTNKGVADAKALLMRTLGQDQGGQAESERHLRRVFVGTILEPLALAVLGAYEQIDETRRGEILAASVGGILGGTDTHLQRAIAYFETAAAAAGARDFHFAEVPLSVDAQRVDSVIVSVLGPVLANLCEVVWSYDCDVLLLSGRPSRLRAVTDIVLAKSPVPPHRVIGMHRYRVGDKYPFRDAANRIEDPKTTAVVGAALSVQAEGRLRNFTLRTRELVMRSTARIIGKMDNNGQIRKTSELLTNLDLDGPPAEDVSFTVSFQSTTQIGFRQLPCERWTATPLYMMEFTNPENAQNLDLPLKVTVRRKDIEGDDDDPAAREDFRVEEISDARGDTQPQQVVRLRLQTINDQDGYWRDTGRLTVV